MVWTEAHRPVDVIEQQGSFVLPDWFKVIRKPLLLTALQWYDAPSDSSKTLYEKPSQTFQMALTLICVIKLLKLSSIEGNFIYASLFYIFKQK